VNPVFGSKKIKINRPRPGYYDLNKEITCAKREQKRGGKRLSGGGILQSNQYFGKSGNHIAKEIRGRSTREKRKM